MKVCLKRMWLRVKGSYRGAPYPLYLFYCCRYYWGLNLLYSPGKSWTCDLSLISFLKRLSKIKCVGLHSSINLLASQPSVQKDLEGEGFGPYSDPSTKQRAATLKRLCIQWWMSDVTESLSCSCCLMVSLPPSGIQGFPLPPCPAGGFSDGL